jgi:hypothetical protein
LSETKNFPNPGNYRLATINGILLDRNLTLKEYGLGVLFLTWQVKLCIPENLVREISFLRFLHKIQNSNIAKKIFCVQEQKSAVEFLLPDQPEFIGAESSIQKFSTSLTLEAVGFNYYFGKFSDFLILEEFFRLLHN